MVLFTSIQRLQCVVMSFSLKMLCGKYLRLGSVVLEEMCLDGNMKIFASWRIKLGFFCTHWHSQDLEILVVGFLKCELS